MLLYGNELSLIPPGYKIYNFNSLKEIGEPLKIFPPNNLGAINDINEYDFDCKYADYLMIFDFPFCEMMKVIMDIYNGNNVFILIDDNESFYNEWNTTLAESFMKFIQQRYGIVGCKVETNEDVGTANQVEFTDYGLMNLDDDKERFSYIIESIRLQNGGQVYPYE